LLPLQGRTSEDYRHIFTEQIVKLLKFLEQVHAKARIERKTIQGSLYKELQGYIYKLDHKLYLYAAIYQCELFAVKEILELKFVLHPTSVRMAANHLIRVGKCVIAAAYSPLARKIDKANFTQFDTKASSDTTMIVNGERVEISIMEKLERAILTKKKTRVTRRLMSRMRRDLIKKLKEQENVKTMVVAAFENLLDFGTHKKGDTKFKKFELGKFDNLKSMDPEKYEALESRLRSLKMTFEDIA
jgi:hypothetical protein